MDHTKALIFLTILDKKLKTKIYNLVHATRFWNKLYSGTLKAKIFER